MRYWIGMNPTDNNADLTPADFRSQPAPAETPILIIVSDQVALAPLRRDLLPAYTRWCNDFGVALTMDYLPGPCTAEKREAR